MMSTGAVGKLHVSALTAGLMASADVAGRVVTSVSRGPVFIRGKGDMETHWVLPGPKLQAIFSQRQSLKNARISRRQSLKEEDSSAIGSNMGAFTAGAGASTSITTGAYILAETVGGSNICASASDTLSPLAAGGQARAPLRFLNTHAAVLSLPSGAPSTPRASRPAFFSRAAEVYGGLTDIVSNHLQSPQDQAYLQTHSLRGIEQPLTSAVVAHRRHSIRGRGFLHHKPISAAAEIAEYDAGFSSTHVGQGALALQKLAGGFQPRSQEEQLALQEDLSRVMDASQVNAHFKYFVLFF
jgi:hypothetical protein